MKKTLKTRIKKWKIGDYVRQFSIVAGGVLLTLWLTDQIAGSAKQREVRQAMQFVALELQNNLRTIENYQYLYNEEKRISVSLQEKNFSTAGMSSDTMIYYSQRAFSGLGKPYDFSTDALEMLKTSGLTSHIADKEQVINVLQTYTALELFNRMMDLYFNMRKEALVSYQGDKSGFSSNQVGFEENFGLMIADPKIQDWLFSVQRGFDAGFFVKYKDRLQEVITKLEQDYN